MLSNYIRLQLSHIRIEIIPSFCIPNTKLRLPLGVASAADGAGIVPAEPKSPDSRREDTIQGTDGTNCISNWDENWPLVT